MLRYVVRQSQQEDAEDVRQTAARSLTTALDDVLRATEHKAPKRKRECELPKEPVPRKVNTASSTVTVYRANVYRRAK